ncbi:MAG TPA: gamma-glutamyltransferase, partial [Saprospiraceae bacterium]|nr:gamma-glutamyltransferase [Saprospiraceae bacterium]
MNKYLMKIKNILLIYLILILFSCKWSGEKHAIYTITKSITADSAAVVSAHPLATAIGLDILRAGGNAADAAIAVQFALAVCYPG